MADQKRIKQNTWFAKNNHERAKKSELTKENILDAGVTRMEGLGRTISDGLNTFTGFRMRVGVTAASPGFAILCQDVGTFDATVDWGDGTSDNITAFNDAALSHTYPSEDAEYTISITGTFPNIRYNGAGDVTKILEVVQLGDVGWLRLNDAFDGASNMTSFVAGTTDTSQVTTCAQILSGCGSLTTLNLTGMTMDVCTDLRFGFYNCSNVTEIVGMNGIMSGPNLVADIGNLCRNMTSLTVCDVSGWDTSNLVTADEAFELVGDDIIDPSGWDVSNVTDMTNFLSGSKMTQAVYDALLVNWEAQAVQNTVPFHAGTSVYTGGGAAADARAALIADHSWSITDSGVAP